MMLFHIFSKFEKNIFAFDDKTC